MVKEFSGSYIFPYKWDTVSACFWVKYPNPFSNHVLSEDVFSRFISDKGVLVTKKLLVKKSNLHIPKWGEKFITIKNGYVVEETHVDPINQVLTSYTKNISLTSLIVSSQSLKKLVYLKNDTIKAVLIHRLLLKSVFIQKIPQIQIKPSVSKLPTSTLH